MISIKEILCSKIFVEELTKDWDEENKLKLKELLCKQSLID